MSSPMELQRTSSKVELCGLSTFLSKKINCSSEVTGGAPGVRQSFIYRSNFTANRNKLLRSHQVLHCAFNGLWKLIIPDSRLRSNHPSGQDHLERAYVECLNC